MTIRLEDMVTASGTDPRTLTRFRRKRTEASRKEFIAMITLAGKALTRYPASVGKHWELSALRKQPEVTYV